MSRQEKRTYCEDIDTKVRKEDHGWIKQDDVISQRKQSFRKSIETLIGLSSDSEDVQRNNRRDAFLKCIAMKCAQFKNRYEVYEVIGEAYERGYCKISKGGEIPNPEAWMKKTIRYILLEKYREDTRTRESHISLHSTGSSNNDGITLLEKIPSAVDSENLFHIQEINEEMEDISKEWKCMKIAFQKLSDRERKILKLKIIDSSKWSRIAIKMKFKGKIEALRKQGSRALKKLENFYHNP